MSRPDPAAATVGRVPRFNRAERITHWVNAALWFVCIATGAMFRFGVGQSLISDRGLVRNIHVIAGLGHPRRVPGRDRRSLGRRAAARPRPLQPLVT